MSRIRYWFQRLYCGHIVDVLADGTMLLCTYRYGHKCPCRHRGRRSA